MKRLNKKGFTMAELLIVVAIIAVLVAIAIPVFTTQLHKSEDATDLANIRSYYAELQTSALTDGVDDTKVVANQSSITLSTGEIITLKNLQYSVKKSSDGNSYVVEWSCKSGTNCKSTKQNGTMGGTATTTP